MSYDIYFVRSDKLSLENINEFLDSEVNDKDEHFIPKALMNEIAEALATNGLRFETFTGEQDDYVELNLDTYQISMSNSQIAVSLPYWDANSSDPIDNEVQLISKVIIDKGFTGYDPQTSRFFPDPTTFSTEFSQVNKKVGEYFAQQAGSKNHSDFRRSVKFVVIFILAFLVMKLLVALVSSLF